MATNVSNFREATRVQNGRITKVTEQLDFYTYTLETTALAPAGVGNDTVNIQADADFVVTDLAIMADVAGAQQQAATIEVPLVRIQLTDTGSGRNLFDQPVDLGIFGVINRPYELPVERRFAANSTIQCTFTNYSAATTYANCRLYLRGFKAWVIG
jgi:hypothetical protein